MSLFFFLLLLLPRYARPLEVLNLDRLQYWISTGRISAEQPITLKVLQDSGCVTRIKHGVKLLGQVKNFFESILFFLC